jgi:hypothetical protein
MAKTWFNYICKFQTYNDANPNGNSTYTVWPTGIYRDALINLAKDRDPSQVMNYNEGRSICYTPDQEVWNKIYDAAAANQWQVDNVIGNVIHIHTPSGCLNTSRIPAIGYLVMDFENNDGSLSHLHPGHRIFQFVQGGLQGTLEDRLNQFRAAIDKYRKP